MITVLTCNKNCLRSLKLMKSILIVSNSFLPNTGGVETHLYHLCSYLDKKGYRILVLTYQPLTTRVKGLTRESIGNLQIFRLQWFGCGLFHRLVKSPLLLFLYLFPGLFVATLLFLLQNNDFIDVIHAQGLVPAFIIKIINWIFKKRCVLSLHSIIGFNKQSFLGRTVSWIASSFHGVITYSQKSRDELASLGVPEEKIFLCRQWVNFKVFKPLSHAKCRGRLSLNGVFLALFVGRFIEEKGVRVLLEASIRTNPKITFGFIGDGPLIKLIKNHVVTQKNILLFGRVSKDDLVKLYNAADIVVVPSQHEEFFGRVVMEALACGSPVVVSNRGNLPNLVENSIGFVVNPTAEDLAGCLNELYFKRHRLRSMRTKCRNYALAKFSERNSESVVKVYA